MKKLLAFICIAILAGCASTSPAQIEGMNNAEREKIFQFASRSNQELCKAYANPNVPLGEATKSQIVEILKSRGVNECFDKFNKLVPLN